MGRAGTSAMDVARGAELKAKEAMAAAEKAQGIADQVASHLQTLVAGMSDLRRDNTQQHTENGAKLDAGFRDLNSRVSSVKTEIAEVKVAVEANKITATQQAIDAKNGALSKVTAQVQKWKDGALKVMAIVIVGLVLTIIANYFHVKIIIPLG